MHIVDPRQSKTLAHFSSAFFSTGLNVKEWYCIRTRSVGSCLCSGGLVLETRGVVGGGYWAGFFFLPCGFFPMVREC